MRRSRNFLTLRIKLWKTLHFYLSGGCFQKLKSAYTIIIVAVIISCIGCKKSDENAAAITLPNEPPLSFNLIEVPNEATGVGLVPLLSWESAKNPGGSTVTYDLFLGTDVNPTERYAGDIDTTSLQITDKLAHLTPYYWKVVAKDVDGQLSQSPIAKFTTRYYQFPEEPLTEAADFSPRFSHASTVFDDKIWLSGGNDGEIRNDVWYSENGERWEQALPLASFPEKYFHGMESYDDKLWIIGGRDLFSFMNDVWFSEDGINWEQATPAAGFSARYSFATAVFQGKLWVVGGNDGDRKNDIWTSANGEDWVQATASAEFSARSGHAVTVFDNRLWIIGGFDGERKNDVWYSDDGVHWTEATPNAPFLERNSHTAMVFDNKIWIVGGIGGEFNSELGDVWYSEEGVEWRQLVTPPSFPRRAQHTSEAFNDRLWLLGGIGFGSLNDIWVTE